MLLGSLNCRQSDGFFDFVVIARRVFAFWIFLRGRSQFVGSAFTKLDLPRPFTPA